MAIRYAERSYVADDMPELGTRWLWLAVPAGCGGVLQVLAEAARRRAEADRNTELESAEVEDGRLNWGYVPDDEATDFWPTDLFATLAEGSYGEDEIGAAFGRVRERRAAQDVGSACPAAEEVRELQAALAAGPPAGFAVEDASGEPAFEGTVWVVPGDGLGSDAAEVASEPRRERAELASAEEREELKAYLARHGSDVEREAADRIVKTAWLCVFPDYRASGTGYSGKLLVAVQDGGPEQVEAYVWKDGAIERVARAPQGASPSGRQVPA